MKKIILSIVVVCCLGALTTFAVPQAVSSKIQKVTVYSTGAMVYRKANIPLQKGLNELVLSDLAPLLDKQSISVGCKGNAKINYVIAQINDHVSTSKNPTVVALLAEKCKLLQAMKVQQYRMKVYQSEENILIRNQQMATEHVAIKAVDLKDMADFQRNRFLENYAIQFSIGKTIDSIDAELKLRDTKIFEIEHFKPKASGEIITTIIAETACTVELDFHYLVPDAGWYIQYDLRVNKVNEPVSLTQYAHVFQYTDENWSNVSLTLSNQKPSKDISMPVLPQWVLPNVSPSAQIHPINQYLLRYGVTEISGRVYDRTTNKGIANAIVLIDDNTTGTITDKDGSYKLKVSPTSNKIYIKTKGYEDVSVAISTTTINLSLNPTTSQDLQQIVNYKNALDEVRYAQNIAVMSSGVNTKEEVRAMAVRGVNEIASASGTYQKDGFGVQIRGGRGNASRVIIDGIPAWSSTNNPSSKIESAASEVIDNLPQYYTEIATAINYELHGSYTINADGLAIPIELKTVQLPATYEYYAIPKLARYAYLMAHLTGWKEQHLLDGQINLYLEGEYLGVTALQTYLLNDTIDIGLGKDQQIIIDRVKTKENLKSKTLSKEITESRAFSIQIKNAKKNYIHLTIEDQFPITTNNSIEVLQINAGGGTVTPESGKISWPIDLAPNESKTIPLEYSVKHPNYLKITLE